ncbi:MAG: alpha/beta fold hydrolase [Spirochaetia bacterium]
MKRTDDEFETRDGVHLARTVWAPAHRDGGRSNSGDGDGGPRGGVLLIHGMAEHRKRYAALAETLAGRGFLVWAYDHRGHGDTAVGPESRRHIAPGNNWTALVEDARELLSALARVVAEAAAGAEADGGGEGLGAGNDAGTAPRPAPPPRAAAPPRTPGPLFALGHSMGSLVLRDALRDPPSPLCGAILMGTAGSGGLKAMVGRALAASVAAFKAPAAPSRLLNDLTFGPYNAAIADAQTEFDWLSRDTDEVRRYIEDPHCGEVMSAHFYRELARGIMRVSSRAAIEAIPHETSLLLMSGTEDPVGGPSGRGVREVAGRLERAGHPHVELRLRAGARHELLHELDRNEVIGEIADWLDDQASTCQKRPHPQE